MLSAAERRRHEVRILALFTQARAVHGGLAPWHIAKAIGIRTDQIYGLYEHRVECISPTARAKLLSFHNLTDADLLRGAFALPDDGVDRAAIAAKVAACRAPATSENGGDA